MKALALLGLLAMGCESPRNTVPDSSEPPQEQMASYIALGDSYTIGEGVASEDRWPAQFATTTGIAPPKIIAKTGWTVNELEAGIAAQSNTEDEYAVVTLQIGVNDEFRGGDLETFRLDFERILVRGLLFARDNTVRMSVVSIPDYGVTPFGRTRAGVSARIDAFNAAAKEITEAHGVGWVDITPISRAMPDAVVADGLHPDAAQYAAWAAEISKVLSSPTPE